MQAMGIGSIVWLIIIQLAAAGLGGYLAGRLRVKWGDTHLDEVYFRDTAHGLVTWSVSTLIAVIFIGTSASAMMFGGAKAGAAVADAGGDAVQEMLPDSDYYVARLLRTDGNWEEGMDESRMSEVSGILIRSLREGEVTDSDRDYLADLVAGRTNLSSNQASNRVDEVIGDLEGAYEQALEAVDNARSAAAWASIWIFISLLAGAFFAALCATWGGRQRDNVLNALD